MVRRYRMTMAGFLFASRGDGRACGIGGLCADWRCFGGRRGCANEQARRRERQETVQESSSRGDRSTARSSRITSRKDVEKGFQTMWVKEVDVREKRGCSFAQSLSLSESLSERSSFLSRLRKIESSATGAGARVGAGVGTAAGVGTVEVLPFRGVDLSTAGTAALVGKGAVSRGEGGSGA